MKKAFASPQAPAAVGPYSQAIGCGDLVFLSGQLGLTADGVLAGEDAAAQARQALANIRAVLAAAGLEMNQVLKTTVFLTDMNDFAAVNEVYREFFAEPFPARSCVQVAALPRGAKVEIEVVAGRG
ncbi:MAG: Rid family detoxifying hydrolase [Firmicutes bacterium]|nr:Rid family detoxifying hydrolase [Bacillota bacterium]